jgi:uncharacterized protein
MTSRMALFTLSIAFLGPLAGSAEAASFNCTKASKPDEIAICDSTKLSDLDVEMATLFRIRMEIPMLMGARGAAQDDQREFLANRAKCGGKVACIEAAYTARIAVLNQAIKAAMQDYCTKLGICG